MPEVGKFSRSCALFTASIQILRRNRILLLFPLISLLAVVVMVVFLWMMGAPEDPQATSHAWRMVFVGVYLTAMFLSTFMNVALMHEVMNAFNGEKVSIRSGFAFAGRRIRPILMWSLFAGLIGYAISRLEQHFGFAGRIIMRLTGVVWSVASVFVIPVMIREPSNNPIALLRKSSGTVKKVWGRILIGFAGMGIVGALLGLFLLLLFLVGVAATGSIGADPDPILLGIGSIIALGTICIVSTADQFYRCALYIYASEGVVPEPYTAELMDAAWKVKK